MDRASKQDEGVGLLTPESEVFAPLTIQDVSLKRHLLLLQIGLTVSLAVNIGFILLFLLEDSSASSCSSPKDLLYSPALTEVSHKIVNFHDDAEVTVYQRPPSDEVDAVWSQLYAWGGLSAITEEEATRLDVPTIRIPSEPSKFMINLDVYHQIHCLDILRKMLYPKYYIYNQTSEFLSRNNIDTIHRSHCIELIRQSLMCHADITPVSWMLKDGGPYPILNGNHMCRDFAKIQAWAKERRIDGAL